MKQNGISNTEIAKTIGKCKTVIGRELARNSDKRNGEYKYELACKKAQSRKDNKPQFSKLNDNIKQEVNNLLREKLSPEQIVGISKIKGVEMVSHETIYKYIWSDKKQKGELYKHLRSQGKKYKSRSNVKEKRGQIPNRQDISLRPPIVEKR